MTYCQLGNMKTNRNVDMFAIDIFDVCYYGYDCATNILVSHPSVRLFFYIIFVVYVYTFFWHSSN